MSEPEQPDFFDVVSGSFPEANFSEPHPGPTARPYESLADAELDEGLRKAFLSVHLDPGGVVKREAWEDFSRLATEIHPDLEPFQVYVAYFQRFGKIVAS